MSDEILSYIKDSVDRIEGKQDKHDERIRKVENWQADANGKVTTIGAIGVVMGGIITAVAEYFKGHSS